MRQRAEARAAEDCTSSVHNVDASPEQRWLSLFGTTAPVRLRSLVEQAVAWKEQALEHGDIAPSIARDLQVVAGETRAARARRQPGHLALNVAPSLATPVSSHANLSGLQPRKSAAAPLPPVSSQLTVGTRLVKAHGGRTHVVEVTNEGMLYEGALFTSLSAVARHITGTHWNGLLFFGLRKRRAYPKAVRNG